MSQFSQLIGSFQRVTNAPIEADYIFSSEKLLNDWAARDAVQVTLHPGLKKLVKPDEGEQIEYWAVEKLDNEGKPRLIFEPHYIPEGNEDFDLDINGTSYDPGNKELTINFRYKDKYWNETFGIGSIIAEVQNDLEKGELIKDLQSQITALQGQIEILMSTGGSGGSGGSISEFKIRYFKFTSGKQTYIVDPNKLTEEEKENGIDIPICWDYNINLNSGDNSIIYLDGKESYALNGLEKEFTIPGIKKSTTIQLEGVSKTHGLSVLSDVIKVTFGVTIYTGGSTDITSFNTSVITPTVDEKTGANIVTIPFESQDSNNYRYFAVPQDVFEVDDPRKLVLRDGNNFIIQGYDITTSTTEDGTVYYMFKLDNILHGSFTIQISDK